MIKLLDNNIIPALAIGIGGGALVYYLFHHHILQSFSFATHHKKHKKAFYSDEVTDGWFTKEGKPCNEDDPGAICVDPSKCHVVGGVHGRYDSEHGLGGYKKSHTRKGTIRVGKHRREIEDDDGFDPTEYDFERLYGDPKSSEYSYGGLSVI